MMDLSLSTELAAVPALRHRVRSLRCFRSSFNRGAGLVAGHLGMAVEVDQVRLTSAFLNWADKFAEQKAFAGQDRQDFSIFSCGLLLAKLIQEAPIGMAGQPHGLQSQTVMPQTLTQEALDVARFWPEGFVLTSYCASVLDVILRQDFGTGIAFAPAATDMRIWHSFRENAREDPSLAIGFFDLFLGREPAWEQPEAAFARPAIKRVAIPYPAVAHRPQLGLS